MKIFIVAVALLVSLAVTGAFADHESHYPQYASALPYDYDASPEYYYPHEKYLPYAVRAHWHENPFDVSRAFARYGITSPKTSPLCGVSPSCYYCKVALAKGLPMETHDVGKECLMALRDSKIGFDTILDEYDYDMLAHYSHALVHKAAQGAGPADGSGAADGAATSPPAVSPEDLKAQYELSVAKLRAVLDLACKKDCAADPLASQYCSACDDPDSWACQREIRQLCASGYSRNTYRIAPQYNVNFLWYKLGKEAGKYCHDYLGRTDDDAKYDAKNVILDAIVYQCEKERLSRPCPRSHRGVDENDRREYYRGYDDHGNVGSDFVQDDPWAQDPWVSNENGNFGWKNDYEWHVDPSVSSGNGGDVWRDPYYGRGEGASDERDAGWGRYPYGSTGSNGNNIWNYDDWGQGVLGERDDAWAGEAYGSVGNGNANDPWSYDEWGQGVGSGRGYRWPSDPYASVRNANDYGHWREDRWEEDVGDGRGGRWGYDPWRHEQGGSEGARYYRSHPLAVGGLSGSDNGWGSDATPSVAGDESHGYADYVDGVKGSVDGDDKVHVDGHKHFNFGRKFLK